MVPPVPVQRDITLHDKNTYRIGGAAQYYVVPATSQVIAALVQWARESDVPFFILGRGSNVLISDQGWPGLIIHTGAESAEGAILWQGNRVTVDGGVPMNSLVKSVTDHGYAGMEELAGIPGTVGGGVIMNAGAFSSCIADTLAEVLCCSCSDGSTYTVPVQDLDLGYRYSRLKSTGDIVLSATFTFSSSASAAELNRRRLELLELRKKKQPLNYPNCGSVFKRPAGNYAGTLIERCGLKGYCIGGAQVSQKHANFIINTGNAKAEEVRMLIALLQRRVYKEKGILLEPEVIFIGTFKHALFMPQERME